MCKVLLLVPPPALFFFCYACWTPHDIYYRYQCDLWLTIAPRHSVIWWSFNLHFRLPCLTLENQTHENGNSSNDRSNESLSKSNKNILLEMATPPWLGRFTNSKSGFCQVINGISRMKNLRKIRLTWILLLPFADIRTSIEIIGQISNQLGRVGCSFDGARREVLTFDDSDALVWNLAQRVAETFGKTIRLVSQLASDGREVDSLRLVRARHHVVDHRSVEGGAKNIDINDNAEPEPKV